MNRPRDYTLNEVNQTERQISYDIPYMWNLEKKLQMNLFTKQKLDPQTQKTN